MKRFLGFIALIVLVLVPMKASAASYGFKFEKTNVVEGTSFDVEIIAVQDAANTFTPSTYTSTMTIQPGAQYVSADSSGSWVVTVDGNTVSMTLGAAFTETEMKVGTLHFNVVSSEDCDVTFVCNGKTTTITNKTPSNPKTGNVLPYAVIVLGITIAGVVYYVTRKNTKFYKI